MTSIYQIQQKEDDKISLDIPYYYMHPPGLVTAHSPAELQPWPRPQLTGLRCLQMNRTRLIQVRHMYGSSELFGRSYLCRLLTSISLQRRAWGRDKCYTRLQWSTEPAVIQSDCSKALDAISNGSLNRSSSGHLVTEIRRRLMEDIEFILRNISRDHNSVADCLASVVRTNIHTSWLWYPSDCISRLLVADCNPIIEE